MNQKASNPGTVPMVLGILSIVGATVLGATFVGPIAGIVLGILGIVQGGKVLQSFPDNGRAKGGKITGIIGLVLSILAFIVTIIAFIFFGMALNQAAENPDEIISQMEELVGDDPESQQQLEELKQELEALNGSSAAGGESGATAGGTSTTPNTSETPSGTETAPATNDSKDYSGGEAFDTWAAECTGANDQPTLYAITELKGWQLETLLQQLGYVWDGNEGYWHRASDGSYYAMISGSNILTDEEIALGDKGGLGTHAGHLLGVGQFGSAREAMSQMSQIVNEDIMFADDEESALAVVYGPSMTEYLVMVSEDTVNGDGYYAFYVFSEEAVADGVFTSMFGEDVGSSISEIWQNVTGVAVGDYISNR